MLLSNFILNLSKPNFDSNDFKEVKLNGKELHDKVISIQKKIQPIGDMNMELLTD